jgi:rhodanese-related sulfurtransferase
MTVQGGCIMIEPERISPKEIYEKLKAGAAILVCAYENDEKFKTFHLEGAISFNEFRSNLPSLSKNREIVFYCA